MFFMLLVSNSMLYALTSMPSACSALFDIDYCHDVDGDYSLVIEQVFQELKEEVQSFDEPNKFSPANLKQAVMLGRLLIESD